MKELKIIDKDHVIVDGKKYKRTDIMDFDIPCYGCRGFLNSGLCEVVDCRNSIWVLDDDQTVLDEALDLLPDQETAEAVLALCQLIQLRERYNQGWQPDWNNYNETKYIVYFDKVDNTVFFGVPSLFFKTKELRDQFLENFRGLIKKLKPLYGVKKGGK